eukprot:symbB.v1.2.009487.t1/scaffold602.1/size182573/11
MWPASTCLSLLGRRSDHDGCDKKGVDTAHQALVLYFLSLGEETKPSRVRLSRLSPAAAQMLRHIRDFLGVVFQIREDHGDSGSVVLSCIGAGITNTARRTF